MPLEAVEHYSSVLLAYHVSSVSIHQSKSVHVLCSPGFLSMNYEREPVKMQGCQLPLIINNATTGYKLQASGVNYLSKCIAGTM